MAEAKRLSISCADLRGTKETRSASEEGRYRTGAAIAVTTYSNLFNINPVLQECDLVVFDDAHGIPLLERAFAKLPEPIREVRVRADGAFFDHKIIDFIEEKRV